MLYIVATPIGNSEDITIRALRVLRRVGRVYCEDTRRTRQLFALHSINTPLESYHHHSSPAKLEALLRQLEQGEEIAYVTDAGTPGISDPGGQLVAAARARNIPITPIPGPSSVTTLLSVAGLPANSFFFAGYAPTKKGRQTWLKKVLAVDEVVVCFETAPRLQKLLLQLEELGAAERQIVVGRELTKQFEEILTGTVARVAASLPQKIRGELVVAIAPAA